MEATPRRRSVHWDDQRDARSAARSVESARDAPSTGSAPRPHGRRDGTALSAAATLSLYLSEALRDSERPSRVRRRHALAAAAGQQSIHGTPPGNDGAVPTVQHASSAPLQPGSPLSRFKQRRVLRDGAPLTTLLRDSSSEAARPERTSRPRALRLSSASASGSMERLLREKINEAKKIREQPSSPLRGEENRPMNRRSDEPLREGERIMSGGSPRLSREVPVPHSKPQRPSMQPTTSTSRTTKEATQPTIDPPPNKPTVKQKTDTESAALRIQVRWRRFWTRRQRQVPGTSGEAESRTEDENSVVGQAGSTEDTTCVNDAGEVDDDSLSEVVPADQDEVGSIESVGEATANKAVMEASIQTDHVESKDIEPAEVEDRALAMTSMTYNNAKTVMWQDDEWSFLEEGRYATNELLDSSTHDEDTSVAALVWKRPHVVIELQEAQRRAAETIRRTVIKKKRDALAVAVAPSIGPHARPKPIRIKIRAKTQRGRHTMALITTWHRRRQRQHRHRQQEGLPALERRSLNEEGEENVQNPSSRDTVTSEQQEPADDPEDGMYEALLAQLHRYVDFSDAPLTSDSSDGGSNAMRNDLITVDSVVPACWSDQEESLRSREEIGSFPGSASSAGTRDESESPGYQGTHFSPSLLLTEASPCKTDDSLTSKPTPSLSPTLQHVEREFHRTLGRIQSQYALALQPLPLYGSENSLSESATDAGPPIDAATQREFRRALDAFEQSLRASRASSASEVASLPSPPRLPPLPSLPPVPPPGGTDPLAAVPAMMPSDAAVVAEEVGDEEEDDDSAVDAELEAMLREIQRCKQQIAQARRHSSHG